MRTAAGASELTVATVGWGWPRFSSRTSLEPQVSQSPEVETQLLRSGLISIHRRSRLAGALLWIYGGRAVDTPLSSGPRRLLTLAEPERQLKGSQRGFVLSLVPSRLFTVRRKGRTWRGYKRSPLRPDGSLCPFLCLERSSGAIDQRED